MRALVAHGRDRGVPRFGCARGYSPAAGNRPRPSRAKNPLRQRASTGQSARGACARSALDRQLAGRVAIRATGMTGCRQAVQAHLGPQGQRSVCNG